MNNIKTNTLFFILIALIFVAYGTLSFIGPQDFIQWFVQSYGLDVEKAKLLPLYIHEMTWLKLKVSLFIVLLFMLYLFYGDKDLLKEYRLSFFTFFGWIKRDLLSFSFKERVTFVALISMFTVALVYYSAITPIQLDELHTWLFFIRRGPLVTAAYYPGSNNHIAYNLLSIPWSFLLSPVWALRMVSLLSAIATVVLFLLILKRRYSFILSVVGILLLMSSTCFAAYAVQGRGYLLEIFFLITIVYLLIQLPFTFTTDRLLVLLNVLAMYCVPIAIIPLILLNGFYIYRIFKFDPNNLKRIIKTSVYSTVLIFLCYLPVGIFSGFEQLINNPFVQRITYHEAFAVGWTVYLPAIWDFISGCEGLVAAGLLVLLVVGTFLVFKKDKFILIPSLLFLLPLLLLQVYPVLLFERTWLWLVIPFVCWCLEIVFVLNRKDNFYTTIAAAIFILTIVICNVIRSHTTNQLLVKSAQQLLELKQAIYLPLQGKTVSISDDVLYNYLLFSQEEPKNYTLVCGTPQSAVKVDALLNNWSSFNPSYGKVIWTDSVHVLYIPE